ncbi:MAG: nucleotide pyrophosphohydrolase, partial [Mycobacterium sp.]
MTDRLDELRARLRRFTDERDWGQFHEPKNLAMALAGEVGELLAELQWLTAEEARSQVHAPPLRERVSAEVADVFIYLVRFADVCGID